MYCFIVDLFIHQSPLFCCDVHFVGLGCLLCAAISPCWFLMVLSSGRNELYLGYARMLWSSIISLWHADINEIMELQSILA